MSEKRASKRTVGVVKSMPQARGATYRTLQEILGRDEYEPTRHGKNKVWPEVLLYEYSKIGSADVQAWRIRQGLVVLPDHEGGDRGCWAARVHRVGEACAELYVQYLGIRVGE